MFSKRSTINWAASQLPALALMGVLAMALPTSTATGESSPAERMRQMERDNRQEQYDQQRQLEFMDRRNKEERYRNERKESQESWQNFELQRQQQMLQQQQKRDDSIANMSNKVAMEANRGDASSQHALAIMYEIGKGQPKNLVLAYMWYELAGLQGNQNSISHRDQLSTLMTPAQIAQAKELARNWKPTGRQ